MMHRQRRMKRGIAKNSKKQGVATSPHDAKQLLHVCSFSSWQRLHLDELSAHAFQLRPGVGGSLLKVSDGSFVLPAAEVAPGEITGRSDEDTDLEGGLQASTGTRRLTLVTTCNDVRAFREKDISQSVQVGAGFETSSRVNSFGSHPRLRYSARKDGKRCANRRYDPRIGHETLHILLRANAKEFDSISCFLADNPQYLQNSGDVASCLPTDRQGQAPHLVEITHSRFNRLHVLIQVPFMGLQRTCVARLSRGG